MSLVINNDNNCPICLTVESDCIAYPCGHTICIECTNELSKCDTKLCWICRQQIEYIQNKNTNEIIMEVQQKNIDIDISYSNIMDPILRYSGSYHNNYLFFSFSIWFIFFIVFLAGYLYSGICSCEDVLYNITIDANTNICVTLMSNIMIPIILLILGVIPIKINNELYMNVVRSMCDILCFIFNVVTLMFLICLLFSVFIIMNEEHKIIIILGGLVNALLYISLILMIDIRCKWLNMFSPLN